MWTKRTPPLPYARFLNKLKTRPAPQIPLRKKHSSLRKTALVTGGGRRLGSHIAVALAEKGFDIVVNYRSSRGEALETAKRIKTLGREVELVQADISRPSGAREIVRKAIRRFGRLDLLVNNASVFTYCEFGQTDVKVWDEALDTNLRAPFLCSQECVPHMLRQGAGRIINIASLGGIESWKMHIPYSVSKAGLIMLTRGMAKALAPKIMVNAVAPGRILMEEKVNKKYLEKELDLIPLNRLGNPTDITGTVVFLAETAEYITGQTIVVDGGKSI